MIFPEKEDAFRFFMDVKAAMEDNPEAFLNAELNLKFAEDVLKTLSGDWKALDTIVQIPDTKYEINAEGLIRTADTREVLTPEFHIDYNRYLVTVFVGEHALFLDGVSLSEMMFGKD